MNTLPLGSIELVSSHLYRGEALVRCSTTEIRFTTIFRVAVLHISKIQGEKCTPVKSMPPSTGCPSDDEHSGDEDRQPFPRTMCAAHSTSGEDESDIDRDDDSDHKPDEVVFIRQDQAVWTLEELEVLSPYKDEWVEASRDEQGTIVEKVLRQLLSLRKQDPGPLRKKIKAWLRRKVKKRRTYGPGKAPPLHTIVAWYKDAELTKVLKEKHGVVPGDKGRFIGLWKTELTALVNDLKNDPARKKELKKMEDKQTRWMEKGPPPDRQKW